MGQRAAALSAPLTRRALALLLGLVLVLGLAACGGDDESPSEQGAATKADEGAATKAHEVAEHGFTVSLPEDWAAISPATALSEEELRALREENPGIRRYIDAISGPDSPIKFFAYDPDVEDGFATNLNVIVLPVGGEVSLEELVEAAVAEVERLPTRASEIESEPVELPAGDAVRLRYRQTLNTEAGEQELSTTQYNLVIDDTSYILTFTTLPSEREAREPVFVAAAESFETTGS